MLYLFIYENYFMYRKFIICECYTSSIIRASISMRTWKPSCKLNTLVKGKWSFENRHWLAFNLSASSSQNVICSFCEILSNSKFRTCFCHNFMKKNLSWVHVVNCCFMYKYCRARRKARRLVILFLHMSSITIISSTCLDSYIADPAVRMFVTRGVYSESQGHCSNEPQHKHH